MADRYYVVTELRSWDITDEGTPLRDTDIVDRLNEQDEDLTRLKAQIMLYHNALQGFVDSTTPEFAERYGFSDQRDAAVAAIAKARGSQ